MEIYSSYLIFIICSVLFSISLGFLYQFKNSPKTPNRFFLLFSALYAFMATNTIVIILVLIHMHPQLWFLFHFHNFMKKSHTVIFSLYNIKIDSLSVLIITIYPLLLFSMFIISQSSLFVLSKWRDEGINESYFERIDKIIQVNTWLEGVKIKLIKDKIPDAFSYSLFRIGWLYLRFEKVITLSTSLMDRIEGRDELEAIIAHEYAHTKEHHTLYSNILVFISTLFFFVPIFKMSKNILWQNSEIKADKCAVGLINSPLPLARALYTLFLINDPQIINSTGTASLSDGNINLIVRRINLLIGYSEEKAIQM